MCYKLSCPPLAVILRQQAIIQTNGAFERRKTALVPLRPQEQADLLELGLVPLCNHGPWVRNLAGRAYEASFRLINKLLGV